MAQGCIMGGTKPDSYWGHQAGQGEPGPNPWHRDAAIGGTGLDSYWGTKPGKGNRGQIRGTEMPRLGNQAGQLVQLLREPG